MNRLLMIVALLLLSACSQDEKADGAASRPAGEYRQPVVYTVNYPLAWMAGQLAGDAVQVELPAPEGVDPAYWQPDTDTVLLYQQADLVLLNGANYARWVGSVSLPANTLVDTSSSYSDQLLPVVGGPVHSHGPEGDHSHGELAITTWLNLELARQQVETIAAALIALLPASESEVQGRQVLLQGQLKVMDTQLQGLGVQLGQAPLLYSHPVYQYLQSRYQLNGRALHWEPDVAPKEEDWQELEALLQVHPAQIMLWENTPVAQTEERLAELGVSVVVFAPMGNRPLDREFDEGMKKNIADLASAVNRLLATEQPH